jgi:death on curing protein
VTAYLAIEDALEVVDRYGFHVRDVGLLAPALATPATIVIVAEAYPELAVKAAALLESIARFHPFIDGNRRTARTLVVLLPGIDGHRHGFTTHEGFDLVVGVAAGTIDLLDSAAQISEHLVPR